MDTQHQRVGTRRGHADGQPVSNGGDLRKSSPQAGSIPALDGARGLAVLLVFAVHGGIFALDHSVGAEHDLLAATKPVWALGRTGVDLFFVLSGFLLFMPYARALLGSAPWPRVGRFYVRRARRVGPAYWVALLTIAVVTGASLPNVGVHAVFLHNSSESTYRSINDVFWSMAVEVQFYLVLPVVAVLLRRFGLQWLWASLLVSPLAQGGLIVAERLTPGAHSFFPAAALLSYWSVFAAGMLCAVLFLSAQAAWARWAGWVGATILVAQVVTMAVGWRSARLDYLLFDTLFGVAYAGLVAAVVLRWQRGARMLSGPRLRWIAVVSYSLYIWHTPLLRALGTVVAPMSGYATVATVGFLCTVVAGVGWLSYRVTERPFLAGHAPIVQERAGRVW